MAASTSTSSADPKTSGSRQRTFKGREKGEKLAPLSERLAKLGLVRDWDFVLHLPLRYEDETRITPISELRYGETCQVEATVVTSTLRQGGTMQLLTQVSDSTGTLQLRHIHFYPSQRKMLAPGNRIRIYGLVRQSFNGLPEIVHPKVKLCTAENAELPKTLTPIYPAGEGITQTWLRKRIDRAILDVDLIDLVPGEFLAPLNLPSLAQSIKELHHPAPDADYDAYAERTTPAWRRLKFDELLAQQIALRHGRSLRDKVTARALAGNEEGLADKLLATLPFTLTGAQQRVLSEIYADMNRTHPMHRLVQGDVGCGKTVVAALAALRAIDSGAQAALMAPTELLAEQHYEKLSAWMKPLGIDVLWLSGSLKAKEKAERQEMVRSGQARMVVGTHALIQEAVQFEDLGLAIVDEQHRFGVNQRLKMRSNSASGMMAHLLALSATPIPRTLAMSYLADIDISVIDELPPGRTPVTTKVISLERLPDVVTAVRNAVAAGGQCYWVCPLIEESKKADLSAATMRADSLMEALPEVRVGLVHGGMSAEDKNNRMAAFTAGEIDVLVATTVIEVGVDVPNASLMIIEHAERFGLSQLHQLRGRVGRGNLKSYCILLFDPMLSPTGRERLRIIRQTSDGFAIAREDLRLRGPGEFMGARQSGTPALRFADVQTDGDLLEAARDDAARWIAADEKKALAHATRWFSGETSYLDA